VLCLKFNLIYFGICLFIPATCFSLSVLCKSLLAEILPSFCWLDLVFNWTFDSLIDAAGVSMFPLDFFSFKFELYLFNFYFTSVSSIELIFTELLIYSLLYDLLESLVELVTCLMNLINQLIISIYYFHNQIIILKYAKAFHFLN